MNPVDAYLQTKQAANDSRRAREHELWANWKAKPNRARLRQVVGAFDGAVDEHLRRYRPPNVQEAALRSNLTRQLVRAIETYDDSRGTQLNTHVRNAFPRSLRTVKRDQNHGYSPEGKLSLIGKFQHAHDELRDRFGRDPSAAEIGRHVGHPARVVAQVQATAANKDIIGSSFESDPLPRAGSREHEVLSLLPQALRPRERQAFDYLYGRSGKPRVTSTSELAKLLGTSPSQVSRIKARILKKFEEYK